MACLIKLVLLVSMTSLLVQSERCLPGRNCLPPKCRCWSDRSIPGRLESKKTPQIVLLSFGSSINEATKNLSEEIMKGLKNPNGCPAVGTYFIGLRNTNTGQVMSLYKKGHEIGLSTMNDTIPVSPDQWFNDLERVKNTLFDAGIPEEDLTGFRSAQLYAGGDWALDATAKLNLKYDSTCVNSQFTSMYTQLWPFTYDFIDHTPTCSIGHTPSKVHNGTWEFLMSDLTTGSHKCASPSSCTSYITTEAKTFEFLFENFLKHYNSNRAPFLLYLDPLWLSNPNYNKGTRRFLNFLGALSDAWMLTYQQALDWMQNPLDKTQSINFPSWGCNHSRRRLRNVRKMRMNQ